jgi:glucosamine--fructose-6-phosphate aminotransferase (isomerizing)
MPEKRSYSAEEILSQPRTWEQSLAALNQVDGGLPEREGHGQILVTGCGSTYYLSVWAAQAIQEVSGQMARPVPASELWLFPENWLLKNRSNVLIAVSRSGTTTETIHALEHFRNQGRGGHLVISCDPDSELAALSDAGVFFPHAKEQSIAQTRSFTNMMLGVSFLIERQVGIGMADRLSSRGTDVLDGYRERIQHIGQDMNLQRFFFLGSGPRYGLACEAMLKMKEMSLSYSEAYHFLEFRHGPMSMVDDQSLVIGLLGKENHHRELSVLKDMKELGGHILALGNEHITDPPAWIDEYIPVDFSGLGSYGDVLYLPLLQSLALERALAKSLNPDKPNNLNAVVVLNE